MQKTKIAMLGVQTLLVTEVTRHLLNKGIKGAEVTAVVVESVSPESDSSLTTRDIKLDVPNPIDFKITSIPLNRRERRERERKLKRKQ